MHSDGRHGLVAESRREASFFGDDSVDGVRLHHTPHRDKPVLEQAILIIAVVCRGVSIDGLARRIKDV
jgi:hypothetical protein